ncbi:MAG TPA: SHOCT domain-containing protein [Treponema sp.]|nr:SHOCT domain-containing protein [Treponema sp.]
MLLRGFFGYGPSFWSAYPGTWFYILHWVGLGILIFLFVSLIISFKKKSKLEKYEAVTKGLDILIERYARGEISAETFKAMKAELEAAEKSK